MDKWDVNRALRTSGLPSAARHIVLVLSDLANVEPPIVPEDRTPSLVELGEFTGLGKGPCAKQLALLEELGWVIRTATRSRAGKGRNGYQLAIGKTVAKEDRVKRGVHAKAARLALATVPTEDHSPHAGPSDAAEDGPHAGPMKSPRGTDEVPTRDRERSPRGTSSTNDHNDLYDLYNSDGSAIASGPDGSDNATAADPDDGSLFPDTFTTGSSSKKTAAKKTHGKADGEPETTQQLVAYWIDKCQHPPPSRTRGHMAKEIKGLVEDGTDPKHIRLGIDAFFNKRDAGPGLLPSLVNSVMNHSAPNGSTARSGWADPSKDDYRKGTY